MKHDMLVIGLGPAGMALSIMGSAMGLKVLAIEQDKIGGECLNSGCIPSKALLKPAYVRHTIQEIERYGFSKIPLPEPFEPFKRIQNHLNYINEGKTVGMFKKVDLIISKGAAQFKDAKTVTVDGKDYTARKIYICTGTLPYIPPVEGIDSVEYLTNQNIFTQEKIPESMFIIGGGAIGCEMAQAFRRMGSKTYIAHIDNHLMPLADEEAALVLEEEFKKEGIEIFNNTHINKVSKKGDRILIETEKGNFETEKILVCAGRRPAIDGLNLESAGVKCDKKGIITDDYGRTNVKNIWAIGDCNGKALFSHAAMHQGMLALMSSMMPLKLGWSKHNVPWSVFTDPELAQVGKTEEQLKAEGVKYEVTKANYGDYGRTITDEKPVGFVKVLSSSFGKIYGVTIVGECASELIHEYILAMHKGIRLHDIMMMQHSFPTISLLNKRVAENWMMKKMESSFLQRMCQFMFRLF